MSKINPNERFSFSPFHAPPLSYLIIFHHHEILKQIKNLDIEKTILQSDIPTKLLKRNS